MHPSLAGGSGWAVTETETHSRRTSWRRPLSPLLSLRQPEEREADQGRSRGQRASGQGRPQRRVASGGRPGTGAQPHFLAGMSTGGSGKVSHAPRRCG
jgi:hypothetical protein